MRVKESTVKVHDMSEGGTRGDVVKNDDKLIPVSLDFLSYSLAAICKDGNPSTTITLRPLGPRPIDT